MDVIAVVINSLLFIACLGWVLNAAVFQAKHGYTRDMWINVLMSFVSAIVLMIRLTPK